MNCSLVPSTPTRPPLSLLIRELKQDSPDVSKEELQALCLYLGKELMSKTRAVATLNNRIRNLEEYIRNNE